MKKLPRDARQRVANVYYFTTCCKVHLRAACWSADVPRPASFEGHLVQPAIMFFRQIVTGLPHLHVMSSPGFQRHACSRSALGFLMLSLTIPHYLEASTRCK